MRCKLLGTAAATAVPLPFCNCRVCREARRRGGKDFRKRSAALINEDLLIDLSPDLCSMAFLHQVDLTKIRYLLQTHSHEGNDVHAIMEHMAGIQGYHIGYDGCEIVI